MTEEKLEKEAREYAEGMAMYYESAHGSIPSQFEKYLRNAYISSAESREKRIAKLEAQIEKMKCCENCKHHRFCGDVLECKIIDCNNLESWELTFGVSN